MQQMLVGLYTGSVLVQTERLSPGLVPDTKPFPLFHGGVRRVVLFVHVLLNRAAVVA